MTKTLSIILAVVAVVVAATVGYYFGYDHGWEKGWSGQANPNGSGGQQQQARVFSQNGILALGENGMKPNVWYLKYEDQSQHPHAVELANGHDMANTIGQRVAVQGTITGDVVQVTSISKLALNGEPDGAGAEFRESGVYGFYGTATLTGYLDVQKRVCPEGGMCGETVDYASFVFTSGANDALKKFTGSMSGNSFISGDRVGLGCQQKAQSRIYWENDADAGYKTGSISGADYAKLVASTKDKPVQLKITRQIYTSGRGAPDCYSHFRDFDVL